MCPLKVLQVYMLQKRERVSVCVCPLSGAPGLHVYGRVCVHTCMCVLGSPGHRTGLLAWRLCCLHPGTERGLLGARSQSSGPVSLRGLIGMQVSLVSKERQRLLVLRGWVCYKVRTWHLFLPQIAQPLRELPGRIHVSHLLWTHCLKRGHSLW